MAAKRSLPVPPSGDYEIAPHDQPTLITAPARRKRRRRWLRVLLLGVLLLLICFSVAGAAVYEDPALLEPVGSALLGAQPGAVPWNGHDPLNILVLGVDQRVDEPTRSDTMMVLHVDPSSRDVTMVSIPRDLWVAIPATAQTNYGSYKINAAYTLGEQYGPHQGPQYAEFTVEGALHIPINYYAVVKFSGFKSIVDAMGGVNICVPQAIDDPTYPADVGYGYAPLHIKAGCQQMDGTTALKYVRERHVYAEQDLGRVQAQQALMTAIEKKLLSPGTILRAPAIMAAFNGAVRTDLPHSALPQLGLLLGRARGDQHTHHIYFNVDGGYVTQSTSADGQAILLPNQDRIAATVKNVFADPQLQAENTIVQVQNGQHEPGLAALYTDILHQLGFNTVAPGNADANTYTRNVLIVNQDRGGADYTARKLAQMMEADVSYRHLGAAQPQVVLILGSDAVEGD